MVYDTGQIKFTIQKFIEFTIEMDIWTIFSLFISTNIEY